MAMRVECFGYDIIIRADRYDKAREWLEDEMGYDVLGEYAASHGEPDDGLIHLSFGEAQDEGPFWGQVSHGTLDILDAFVEEFACEGSFVKLMAEDEGTSLTMVKASRSSIERRTVGIDNLFDEIEEELDSMLIDEPYLIGELSYEDAIFQYGIFEDAQLDDR